MLLEGKCCDEGKGNDGNSGKRLTREGANGRFCDNDKSNENCWKMQLM